MLQQGSSGDEVLKLQNMLTTLGFYTGNKTGNFGALTADAVTAYQKSQGADSGRHCGQADARRYQRGLFRQRQQQRGLDRRHDHAERTGRR